MQFPRFLQRQIGQYVTTGTGLHKALGKKHTHTAQAHDLANKFNYWVLGKIFIGVEDANMPREALEVLKPMITNGESFGIQAKGQDQTTARICANVVSGSSRLQPPLPIKRPAITIT